jgi:hypothetical protein
VYSNVQLEVYSNAQLEVSSVHKQSVKPIDN